MENNREVINHSGTDPDSSDNSHPSAHPESSLSCYSFMRGLDSEFAGYDTEDSVEWQGYGSNKSSSDSATIYEEEDSATDDEGDSATDDEVDWATDDEGGESDRRDVISYCSSQDFGDCESDSSKSDVDNRPKFTVTVRSNNLICHYGINIPMDFARRFVPRNRFGSMSMELRTWSGSFEVYYRFIRYRGGYQLGYGWKAFVENNSLRVNDRLEFILDNPARQKYHVQIKRV